MDSNFWFTNAVSDCFRRHEPLSSLLEILLETEQKLGRVRNGKKQGYQDRKMDLDLIYFGSTRN